MCPCCLGSNVQSKHLSIFVTSTEEPHGTLEVEMRDNLCGVLARFYQKCNNEGFLSSPIVSLYLVEGVPPKYTLQVTRKNKYEYVLLEKKTSRLVTMKIPSLDNTEGME